MKIIQFRCLVPEIADQLKAMMVSQINEWSRLRWLKDDPEYATDTYDVSCWKQHLIDPAIYWVNWTPVYENLGESGKLIADQMLGNGPMQGVLLGKPLVNSMPEIVLNILNVIDPVSEGYLLPLEDNLPLD